MTDPTADGPRNEARIGLLLSNPDLMAAIVDEIGRASCRERV